MRNRRIYRFRDIALARAFRYRCSVPMRLVLGDDDVVWVVTPAQAALLETQGYTIAG